MTGTGRGALGVLAGAGLLLSAAAPAAAAGDGLRLGFLTARPGLTLAETYESNIYLASEGETSDWITTITPALTIDMPFHRFLLRAEGSIDVVRYADHEAEDSTGWNAGGSLGADFPGGLSFELAGSYRSQFFRSSQEFGPGEDGATGTASAVVGYRIRDALKVELGWVSSGYSFDRSVWRERAEDTLRGTLYWAFRPRTSALVEAARTDFAYDSNAAQDSTETQVALGLAYDATDRTKGLLKAGWEWKEFDEERPEEGLENAEYFTVTGALRHAFTRRTAAELELRSGSVESDFPDNPYYIRTGFSAGVGHRFTWKLHGRAFVRYDRHAYPNATTYTNPYDPARPTESGERSDTLTGLAAALGFDAFRWLTVELECGRERRTSNFETFEYTDTTVTLRAKAAF